MNIGSIIYLIIMGVLDCWVGIILYVIALKKKSKRLFIIGLIFQMLCNFGLMSSSNASIDSVTSVVFFLIFTVFVATKVYGKEKSSKTSDNTSKNNNVREDIKDYTSSDLFSVCIFDGNTHAIRKEKRKIDVIKFPASKYANNNTYYAIETVRDGKKVRSYYTMDNWNKQIESAISQKEI